MARNLALGLAVQTCVTVQVYMDAALVAMLEVKYQQCSIYTNVHP